MSKPTTIRYKVNGASKNARQTTGQPPKDCPKCGAMGGVVDTRYPNNIIRRRRICKRGHRWTTVEILVKGTRTGLKAHDQAGAQVRRSALDTLIRALKEMRANDR